MIYIMNEVQLSFHSVKLQCRKRILQSYSQLFPLISNLSSTIKTTIICSQRTLAKRRSISADFPFQTS